MDPASGRTSSAGWRLPRTRGDGPGLVPELASALGASPHTRGWTLAPDLRDGVVAGFPAHAGMDPAADAGRPMPPGLPRTRGDGPSAGAPPAVAPPASPHTRGWTRARAAARPTRAGFPAHAGMDPFHSFGPVQPHGLPRTRGDGPATPARRARPRPASPHTRGWTRADRRLGGAIEGFPAHAGMDRGRRGLAVAVGGLPRTRGDGPCLRVVQPGLLWASPHTRGWTVVKDRVKALDWGFPAHAGMDPRRPPSRRRPRWLPRTRGDGPAHDARAARVTRASPHTRGWTRLGRPHVEPAPGFPAHAGMDRARDSRSAGRRWLPRTRGDGPPRRTIDEGTLAASPHTRGWTRAARPHVEPAPGFPAHAGMDLRSGHGGVGVPRLPRTRGDGPIEVTPTPTPTPASPHTRGWTHRRWRRPGGLPGFPAHAGMDPTRSRASRATNRLPRTRGDGPPGPDPGHAGRPASPHTRGWTASGQIFLPRLRASPHTRGWTPDGTQDWALAIGFPAHAGMDPARGPYGPLSAGLPRTRGDGPGSVGGGPALATASPHTRGWTLICCACQARSRGFPAHAGMDPTPERWEPSCTRLPRTRGDGPVSISRHDRRAGASPHTRGWTRGRRGHGRVFRGFPAHAGMDPRPRRPAPGPARLPRTRGDGPARSASQVAPDPASPHTRGWTPSGPRTSSDHRGFPAHAGMDPIALVFPAHLVRLPRTRGDGPRLVHTEDQRRRASPHTRGWTASTSTAA